MLLRPIRSLAFLRRPFSSSREADIKLARAAHPRNNIPVGILDKLHRKLHLQANHPLNIIKTRIENYCNTYAATHGQTPFQSLDDLSPVVDPVSCFDDLRVEPSHVSRRPSDTYYISDELLLRTHTSAHQTQFIAAGTSAFLCSGDVYRRDEIDSSHYPIFHQMEGVRVFRNEDYLQTMQRYLRAQRDSHNDDAIDLSSVLAGAQDVDISAVAKLTVSQKKQLVQYDLKELLFGLAKHLFGQNITMKWREDYFPFTEPSFELDILFLKDGEGASPPAAAASQEDDDDEKWLEVLGCGVVHDDVMNICRARAAQDTPTLKIGEHGWAFGLGLERLAMVLFSIPDIRLFWSSDERFLTQFSGDKITKFAPFSKYPLCYKDVSFWLPVPGAEATEGATKITAFHPNEVFEIIRGVGGDLVEKVRQIDEFTHPKTGKVSHAYRIEYRSMERSLTNEEVDRIQLVVRERLVKDLDVQLR